MSFRKNCTVIVTSSSNFFQWYHSLLIIVLLFICCIIYSLSFSGHVKAIEIIHMAILFSSFIKGKGIPHFAFRHQLLWKSPWLSMFHNYQKIFCAEVLHKLVIFPWIRQSESDILKKKKKKVRLHWNQI